MSKLLITALLKTFFSITTRLKLFGIEKILHEQPVIVTGNHIGFLDGLLLPIIKEISSHKNLIVVIAEKYKSRPLYKWAIDSLNFIFIDRFNADAYTVRKVLRMLKDNGLMILAPEGTRSPNASLIEGQSGAAYFASKTGALIVPIGATGTEDSVVKRRFKKLRRLDVSIRVGEPYTIPPLPKENREAFLDKYTDEVMCRIAALLPPSYRGIYADHPRLKELLAEGGGAPA
jgi:1-acyl-sn-glycerol-3-phosphate acyltransferase